MQDKSDRNYDNKEHEFLSDAVIRNSEVLYRNERTAQSPTLRIAFEQQQQMHRRILQKHQNSEMNTYPRIQHEKPYTIEFKFLSEIIEVLDQCDASYFDSIYGQGTEFQQKNSTKLSKETAISRRPF